MAGPVYPEAKNHYYWKYEIRKSVNKKSQMSLRDVLVLAPLSIDYPGVAVRQWLVAPVASYFNVLHSAYILHSKYCFS